MTINFKIQRKSNNILIYVLNGKDVIDMNEWFLLISGNKQFRKNWNKTLSSLEFNEFTIKSPQLSLNTASMIPAMFYIHKVKFPEREQDHLTFSEHWPNSKKIKTVVFPSKTNKSILVVPVPHGRMIRTIGEFVRNSTSTHIDDFWKTVGNVPGIAHFDPTQTFYFETHGFDVAWLHLKYRFI
jgi:hypothetical protein